MWFFYALAFAVISSFSVLVAKKVMKSVDQYAYLLLVSIFTAPLLLFFAIIIFGLPVLDKTFWIITLVSTTISVIASILAYKAIRENELSLVSPISAFNPVFTAIISFFILKEVIGVKGILGMSAVVIGAYVLQISKLRGGFWKPFKALITNKGVRLSFFAYFLWAATPLFEKTAIFHTFPQNPPFAAFIGKILAIIIFIPVVLKKSKTPIKNVVGNWKWILLDGFLGGVGITVAFIAYSLSPLGLVTAVFKLSVIFVPILGWIFFKEHNIKERLLGSLIMLIGVALLVS